MGPFGLPWLTFTALLVVAASIVLAVLWAARPGGDDRGPGRDQ